MPRQLWSQIGPNRLRPRRAIVTDGAHTAAAPLAAQTREAVAREIVPRVAEGRVPVLGGFVGATVQGVTTTLGRGGSDYSAAIVGAALGTAAAIQQGTGNSAGKDSEQGTPCAGARARPPCCGGLRRAAKHSTTLNL